MTFSDYYQLFSAAVAPYWGEIVGAVLMAMMINIITNRGSQKETFLLFRCGFYTLIISNLIQIVFALLPTFAPTLIFSQDIPVYAHLILTALATVFFIAASLKNVRFYFSAPALIAILTFIFSSFSILSSIYSPIQTINHYLSPVYLILGFFISGCSFYMNQTTRQKKSIRIIGDGFFILSIGTCYQAFDIVQNSQQVILMCYTIATVLALGAQIQFLNFYANQMEDKLLAEKKSKRETWEISPFPIMISRLRDDRMVYMNPVARRMLETTPEEVSNYTLADYFVDAKRREDLILQLQRLSLINSFEVQVHHPNLNNIRWIDITTRTTDLDDEIVLYTTFKDITEQKESTRVLKEQASTDPLTGLYNRRQFEIMAYQGLQSAKRYQHPFSIAMIDIDFFKKVNDTYGHEAGDAVLQNLSKTLTKTLRKADIIARYGGEEFVIFLTNTSPNEGRIALEHVRESVSKMTTTSNNVSIPITISVGVSEMQTFNLNALIKQADDALYSSKHNGRNRVTLYRDLFQQQGKPAYPQMPNADSAPKAKPLYPPMPTSGSESK